jgi:two-component system chemotaxis response regulator CheY
MTRPRVLSVGQCGPDHGSISRVLDRHFSADVVAADTHAEAISLLDSTTFDLALINRVGDLDGAQGLELIRSLKSRGCVVPLMLVSNYADAQSEAISLGALPGFGKADLSRTKPPEALDAALRPKAATK